MPNVLAKLGADVLAVNPYASTTGAISFNRQEHAENVAGLVRASGAHVGAVIDPDGERLSLIDDEGHVLSDTESLLALLTLVSGHILGDRVALPVNVTSQAERVAAAHGVGVQWTKISTSALMDAALEPGVGFAASDEGGFILPGFLPAFDAAATFVKVLELLARSGERLSKVVAGLPRVHVAHEIVVTPWEQKGMVMRTLVERTKEREMVLVDGVKLLHDDGWALALPDPEEPVTHVWAEAGSDADARRLAQEYARRIRQMMR
jgi:mannose-1-phosphate guanylyltransferase/phosphomannomutase